MKKIYVLFGNFTFHHLVEEELKLFKKDTEQKALIHELHRIIECDTIEDAGKLIDELENQYDSWIIPGLFKGEVIYEPDPKKTVADLCNTTFFFS